MATTLLSEEAGYRLKQAQMPDGKMVELKVPVLGEPSISVARAAQIETDYDHSILGATYGMMSGSLPQRLYSLAAVEDFMRKPEGVADPLQVQFEKIGYVDLGVLADWIDKTIEDHELATAIREVNAQESIFGKAMPFIKELLQERLAAYRQVLAEVDGVSESSENDEESTGPAMQDEVSEDTEA
ncbi:MAG: hypothetical protein FWD65_01940 [Coriobacteriia bacterium]|nr:hypothetical protein [Coriobacteriia bacterium]